MTAFLTTLSTPELPLVLAVTLVAVWQLKLSAKIAQLRQFAEKTLEFGEEMEKVIAFQQAGLDLLLKGQAELCDALTKTAGLCQQTQIKSKIAEKTADRAYTLGGSANVAVAILQKAISARRPTSSAEKARQNEHVLTKLVKEEDDLVNWMAPTLTEEEREIVEEARRRVNGGANKNGL